MRQSNLWVENPVIRFIFGVSCEEYSYIFKDYLRDCEEDYKFDTSIYYVPFITEYYPIMILLFIANLFMIFANIVNNILHVYASFGIGILVTMFHTWYIYKSHKFPCMKIKRIRNKFILLFLIMYALLFFFCELTIEYGWYSYKYYHFSQKYSEKYSSNAVSTAFWEVVDAKNKTIHDRTIEDVKSIKKEELGNIEDNNKND